jgi:cytochrome c2
VLLAAGLLAGCGGGSKAAEVPGGDASEGKQLIERLGCGSCHEIPGIEGADGRVGPPLDNLAERRYIAGKLENSPDNVVRWITDPQGVNPGTAMPDLGVSDAQARDITAYLYSH